MIMIRKIRRDRDITQKQLAEAVGVTQQAVAKWEKSFATPRAALLPKIAAELGCAVDDLFGNESAHIKR